MLRISGEEFDSASFASRTSMPVVKVYKRGESRLPRTQPHAQVNEISGVNIEVSSAPFEDLARQIDDAIAFLTQWKNEIRQIATLPGVEGMTLDFAVADRDAVAQSDYFPPELLALLGSLKIGIELTRYGSA